MTAEEIVRDQLGTAEVAALVGPRVYPLRIAQGASMPAIAYQRVSASRAQSLRGPTGLANPRIQVTCWGDSYKSAKDVATQVRLALDGFTEGDVSALLVGERDLQDPDGLRSGVALDFSVWVYE